MSELINTLLFLSIFHVIGGVALGITLRGWVNEPTLKNLLSRVMFLVWGSGFGCLPLAFAFDNAPDQISLVLAVQSAILLTAIAIPFFWLDRLRELASDKSVVATTIGGIFLVVGLVAGSSLLRGGEWLGGLLFGGTFTLVGGGVLWHGLRSAFKGFSEDG